MSLVSLRKSAPSTNSSRQVSVDDFIEAANLYAAGGQSTAVESHTNEHEEQVSPMRRATFTLSEECIKQLTELSSQSGQARSYLIRCWIPCHWR